MKLNIIFLLQRRVPCGRLGLDLRIVAVKVLFLIQGSLLAVGDCLAAKPSAQPAQLIAGNTQQRRRVALCGQNFAEHHRVHKTYILRIARRRSVACGCLSVYPKSLTTYHCPFTFYLFQIKCSCSAAA
jgi:hypothetical protein